MLPNYLFNILNSGVKAQQVSWNTNAAHKYVMECLGRLKPLFKHDWFHNSAVELSFAWLFSFPKSCTVTADKSDSERKHSFYFYFNTVLEKNFFICFLIRHSQRSRIRVLASSLNSWVPSWVCVMTSLISFLLMCLFSIG